MGQSLQLLQLHHSVLVPTSRTVACLAVAICGTQPDKILKTMGGGLLMIFCTLLLLKLCSSLPTDGAGVQCSNQTICYGIQMVFTDLSQGGEGIRVGNGFDQQRDFIKNTIVNLADKNWDGKVDFQEFKERSFEFFQTIFNIFDRNNDGLVDSDEATIENVSQKAIRTFVMMVFDIFDQNQDENISTDDIPNNESLDINSDGKVTLDELLSKVSDNKITNTIYLPKPLQTLYKILDSNKDEKTSKEEIENFITVIFKLFNVLDKDSNCLVTMKEVIEVMDKNEVRKDFQLTLDIVTSPYIKLFRYILTDFIAQADTNEDAMFEFEELIDFTDTKQVENYLKTAVSLWSPNYSALYYLMGAPGGPDRFGRPNWEDGTAAQRSLAVWLSLAD